MQDTADTTEPAGQADDTTTTDVEPAGQAGTENTSDDEQAQLMLADAVNGTDTEDASSGKPRNVWDDPESARQAIEKLRRESASRRTQLREAEALAAKWREYEDSQKTEIQRATEQAEASQRELTRLREANARLMAAANHNIPPDLIDFLGSGTEEEIDERAKVLAAKLPAAAAPAPESLPAAEPRPAPRRPVESLTPGASLAGEPPADTNEAFRGFLNSARR